MRTTVDVRFEKGDPVREYWLAHGVGFAVENRRGRVVGQVVDVVVDPDRQRVMSLVVQKSRGMEELPAEQIQAVVPARDTFVLDGAQRPAREEKRSRPPKLRRARAVVRASGAAVLAWVVAVARLLGRELQRRPQ
ncbi:MAG: PRC-barrel domain-containing protein [Gaiellaceae bacterium]